MQTVVSAVVAKQKDYVAGKTRLSKSEIAAAIVLKSIAR